MIFIHLIFLIFKRIFHNWYISYWFTSYILYFSDLIFIHVVMVIGHVFCFKNHKYYNSYLKWSYSHFLLLIFISLVRENSGDSGKLINCDKGLFIGWIIRSKISKLCKKLKLQVKSDNIPVINSYTITLTAILTT